MLSFFLLHFFPLKEFHMMMGRVKQQVLEPELKACRRIHTKTKCHISFCSVPAASLRFSLGPKERTNKHDLDI